MRRHERCGELRQLLQASGGKRRRVLEALERVRAGVLHRVRDPDDRHLALMHIALERDLVSRYELLDEEAGDGVRRQPGEVCISPPGSRVLDEAAASSASVSTRRASWDRRPTTGFTHHGGGNGGAPSSGGKPRRRFRRHVLLDRARRRLVLARDDSAAAAALAGHDARRAGRRASAERSFVPTTPSAGSPASSSSSVTRVGVGQRRGPAPRGAPGNAADRASRSSRALRTDDEDLTSPDQSRLPASCPGPLR